MRRAVVIVAALVILTVLTAATGAEDPLHDASNDVREQPSRQQNHGEPRPPSRGHRRGRRSLLSQGESWKQAHERERAAVDAIPTDEVGVDEFEAEWSDPSWQAGATGATAHVTHTGCTASIVEWNHAAARPIWSDAPGRAGARDGRTPPSPCLMRPPIVLNSHLGRSLPLSASQSLCFLHDGVFPFPRLRFARAHVGRCLRGRGRRKKKNKK